MAEENIEGQLAVPKEWANRGTNFALRVHGNSMIDAGIQEGDYVVVRQQVDAEHGDIVVAAIEGETTLKRLCRSGRTVLLRAENPRYPPIKVQTGSSMIQGVVVGLMRAYARGGRWVSQAVNNSRSSRLRKQTRRTGESFRCG